MDWLMQLLGLGGGGLLTKEAYDRLGTIGDNARTGAASIAQQGLNQAQFTPYTVTTGLGNIQTDAAGGYTLGLSPQQQSLQNMLGSQAQNFYNNAAGSQASFEQNAYDRIRALQQPEEERQALALENRLNSQGRLGVRTAAYGGTPEQLAMAKAQQEGQNQAALMAIQQGNANQMQQANLGQMYQQSGYLPQASMLSAFGPALQNAQLANQAKQYGAGLFGTASMGGLEAQLGAGLGQANLMGQLGAGLLSGTMGGMGQQILNTGVSSLGSAANSAWDTFWNSQYNPFK